MLVELTCKSVRGEADFGVYLTLKSIRDGMILLELTRKSARQQKN